MALFTGDLKRTGLKNEGVLIPINSRPWTCYRFDLI